MMDSLIVIGSFMAHRPSTIWGLHHKGNLLVSREGIASSCVNSGICKAGDKRNVAA